MTMNPREKDFRTKKESVDPNMNKFPKITTSSARQWSTYKNPRIVRVSRNFGGKDRHSKVCTVRGLRDRRIRLSVPTAIQLYDLQDRLGLSQPSKVVDWLLDVTKHEIDKLPPLPMLPQFQDSSPQSSLSHFLIPNHPLGLINQNKELGIKMNNETIEGKDKWIPSHHHQEQENQEGFSGFVAQNLFPLSNQSSFPNMPYNSLFHWDPPNLSLSQFGGGYSFSAQQTEDHQPSSSQLYFCPSAIPAMPSIIPPFPSYISTPSMENVTHQQNPLLPTTLHLISSPMKTLALKSSQENTTGRSDKDNRNP